MSLAAERVFGFDLGTQTGVALRAHCGDGVYSMKTWALDLTTMGDSWAQRYRQVFYLVSAMVHDHAPEAIAYESPSFMRGRGALRIKHLEGIVELVAGMNDIPAFPVEVSSLKKWAAHGRAKKPEMVAAARDRGLVGRNATDDEAEAALVAEWLMANLETVG